MDTGGCGRSWAHAARDTTPGPLRGYIDELRGDWKLYGWAHDVEHPELPVLLEAGRGQGRCSFAFMSPFKLRRSLLTTLQVRRAVDGEPVARRAPSLTLDRNPLSSNLDWRLWRTTWL